MKLIVIISFLVMCLFMYTLYKEDEYSKQQILDTAVEVVDKFAAEYTYNIPKDIAKVKGVGSRPRIKTTCPPGVTSAPDRFDIVMYSFGESLNELVVDIQINGKKVSIDKLPSEMQEQIRKKQARADLESEARLLETLQKAQEKNKVLVVSANQLEPLIALIGRVCAKNPPFQDVTLIVLSNRADQRALEAATNNKIPRIKSAKIR